MEQIFDLLQPFTKKIHNQGNFIFLNKNESYIYVNKISKKISSITLVSVSDNFMVCLGDLAENQIQTEYYLLPQVFNQDIFSKKNNLDYETIPSVSGLVAKRILHK